MTADDFCSHPYFSTQDATTLSRACVVLGDLAKEPTSNNAQEVAQAKIRDILYDLNPHLASHDTVKVWHSNSEAITP